MEWAGNCGSTVVFYPQIVGENDWMNKNILRLQVQYKGDHKTLQKSYDMEIISTWQAICEGIH